MDAMEQCIIPGLTELMKILIVMEEKIHSMTELIIHFTINMDIRRVEYKNSTLFLISFE